MDLAHETVFRPNPRELIREAFQHDQRRYFSREFTSYVDEFFYLFFVEFICGLFPVVEKTNGLWRRKVLQSLVKSYPLLNEDSAARWVPSITAAESAQTLGEELAVFLEIMRESYCAVIRGPKTFCWERAAPMIERDSHLCPSREDCWDDSRKAIDPLEKTRCARYSMGWTGTELAIRSWEAACDTPQALVRRIHQKCPLLKLSTDPAGLFDYLREQYFSGRHVAGPSRTSRGAVVRVLSALVDHCLEDLNAQLALSGESRLAFLRPPRIC